MRRREHRFHANNNILDFQRTDNGFKIIALLEPDIELEDKVILEAFGGAPEISGPVNQLTHDLGPAGQFTEIRVWSYRAEDILKHEREYGGNSL